MNSLTRGHAHAPSDKAVRVAWVDEGGQLRCAPGKCIDISDRRVHVEVLERIVLGTRVSLSVAGNLIAGPSVVKYLTQCGASFIMVLE